MVIYHAERSPTRAQPCRHFISDSQLPERQVIKCPLWYSVMAARTKKAPTKLSRGFSDHPE